MKKLILDKLFYKLSIILLSICFNINNIHANINISPSIGFLFYNFGSGQNQEKHYNGSLFVDFTHVYNQIELGFGAGFDKLVVNKAGYNISYEDAIASNNYFDDINVRPIYVVVKYSINSILLSAKIGGAIAQGIPYQESYLDGIAYITPKTAMFSGINLGYMFNNNFLISLDFVSYQIKEDALIVKNNVYTWQPQDRYENKIGVSLGYRFNIKY